jgi:hypothetical protein
VTASVGHGWAFGPRPRSHCASSPHETPLGQPPAPRPRAEASGDAR